MELTNLKDRWLTLNKGKDIRQAENVLQDMIAKYAEPQRFYHCLSHVEDCLRHFNRAKPFLEFPQSIELALWFHDVIYDPKKGNNEAASAAYAKEALAGLGYGQPSIQQVGDLILITKHPSSPISQDEKFLVDIDLAILGAPKDVYKRYANDIRSEYDHVPQIMYALGRKKVLKRFLKAESIYCTELFGERYEKAARENLQWELSEL